MKSCLYLLLLSSLYLSTNVSAFEAKTNKKAEEQRHFSIGINGNAMLRFENETFAVRNPRQRLRFIGRVGLTAKYAEFTFVSRLSTGLKNRQNVPAITVIKFNSQPQPDSDIFVERLFMQYRTKPITITVGKQPWAFANQTDTFWDRQLNPQGVHANYQFGSGDQARVAWLKPLDGATDTVGKLVIVQYETSIPLAQGKLVLAPWWVDYQGGSAQFAKRDTQYDHQSLRFSGAYETGLWRYGVDAGYTLDAPELISGNKQNQSLAIQINYGKLKKQGDYQAHLRFFRTERFGVISEFAQNATAGFATANIKGFDTRVRYRISRSVWVGVRYSQLDTITGTVESSHRFRIETAATF
ncbi:MAG TPA: hypothetical protein DER52_07450 [Glaciecola sp.]|nr:hypothetical protein [Glaciecola sp.]